MTEKREDFTFDAPQFYDFSNGEESAENLEEYFNIDHYECEKVIEAHETHIIQESMEYQEFYTPMSHSPGKFEYHEESPEMPPLRRSMSVGNILQIPHMIKDEDNNLVKKMDQLNVTCKVSTEKDRKSRLTEHMNRLSRPKRLYSSTENLQNKDKFVSMAELVNKFQSATPVRFRSKPPTSAGKRPQVTKAHSPALTTKNRARPVYALSQEEKEIKEMEEAKKFKIRAHPVNKKVMQGPMKAINCVPKKPSTVPEPFKITSYPKKAPPTPEVTDKYEFHAKPVPKSVLEPAKHMKLPHKVTVPQTPSFMKHYNRVTPKKDVDVPDRRYSSAQKEVRPTATRPAPFSFEKRDQAMMKRREELVKKVIEEEKKAREFHAKPIPKSLYRPPSRDNSASETSRQTSFTSIRSTKSDDGVDLVAPFKARPAKVLHMKPFKPKKEERPLTEIAAFDLNTDRRVRERAEFDQRLREKEEKIEALKRAEEEMQRLREAEEAARAREETKFKANPIKTYKEVQVQPSGKVTEPISPRWHTNRLRNKENIADNH